MDWKCPLLVFFCILMPFFPQKLQKTPIYQVINKDSEIIN